MKIGFYELDFSANPSWIQTVAPECSISTFKSSDDIPHDEMDLYFVCANENTLASASMVPFLSKLRPQDCVWVGEPKDDSHVALAADYGFRDVLSPGVSEQVFAKKLSFYKRFAMVPKNKSVDFDFDPKTATVSFAGEIIRLTIKESSILKIIIQSPDHLADRHFIQKSVFGYENKLNRCVDVHLHNLRRKLNRIGYTVESLRGIGRDDSYFKVWPTDIVDNLKSLQPSILVCSAFTVSKEYRKQNVHEIPVKDLLAAASLYYLKTSDYLLMVGNMRNTRGANKVVYKFGAEFLRTIDCNSEPSDLVLFPRNRIPDFPSQIGKLLVNSWVSDSERIYEKAA